MCSFGTEGNRFKEAYPSLAWIGQALGKNVEEDLLFNKDQCSINCIKMKLFCTMEIDKFA